MTEVTGDGRKVWVNTRGRCVGRICEMSMEIGDMSISMPPDWPGFVRAFAADGVEIPERLRPTWVTG